MTVQSNLEPKVEPSLAAAKSNTDADKMLRLAKLLNVDVISEVGHLPSGIQLISDPDLRSLSLIDQRFAVTDTGECVIGEYSDDVRNIVANIVTPKLLERGLSANILPAKPSIVQHLIATAKNTASDSAALDPKRKRREPAQRHLDAIISSALDERATDIHLHVRKNTAHIAFRIDRAVRIKQTNVERDRVLEMIRAAINYTATMEGGQASGGYNIRQVNDASVMIDVEGRGMIPVRLSSLPNKDGGSVILRLLTSSDSLMTLEELGYLPEQQAIYKDTAKFPYGGILTSGPTGSGKSTTVAAALRLVSTDRRVITFEDPIEHDLVNASQVPVNPKNPNTTWEVLLEASLRQDPDVMFFSEIRNKAVAALFSRASSTGHLVYATIHANTATQIPRVLHDMGLPLSTLTDESFLRVIGSQRLIKRLCSSCSTPIQESNAPSIDKARLQEYFGHDYANIKVANPYGCDRCVNTGFSGVGMVAEVIRLDTEDREYIANEDYAGWRKALVEKGWVDIREHARKKVATGNYCPFSTELEVAIPFGSTLKANVFNYQDFRQSISEEK